MKKNTQSLDYKIISRIYGNGRGWVFTPNDFLDLGSKNAILLILMRYHVKKKVRSLSRGLYDYPRKHPTLGFLSPTIEAIASALQGKDSIRIQPSGAYATNLLGLSEQVPMKVVFLTDGRSRKVQIGKQVIELKRTTPRNLSIKNSVSALVIHALRHLGKDHVDEKTIEHLKKRLTHEEKRKLIQDRIYAPAWIASVIQKIVQDQPE